MSEDILIIAHYCDDFDCNGNNRFNYLAELLNNDFNVELVTSDYSHNKKRKRSLNESQVHYKVTYIEEPTYKKNVSLKRLYSNFIIGRNLRKYLEKRSRPDVIYCAVPSLDFAKAAADYAKKNGIRFVIDVQDLWPEAFKMVFKVPFICDLLLYPMKQNADYIYKTADEIIAVSDTYASRALKVNNKCKDPNIVYLGTDLADFDRLAEENKWRGDHANEIWIAYVGTLGHSYDLINVIDALKLLKEKGINDTRFIVMGDGPLRTKFEDHARNQGINVWFTGRLDYSKMVGILKRCDIAVNPISKGAAASIINKHADYAAAGLPVINSQESIEYKKLVDKYRMGLNCNNNSAKDMADKILTLYEDIHLRNKMGDNSRMLAEEKFDRSKTYLSIYNAIIGIS